MRLNPPTKNVFYISVAVVVLAIISAFVDIPVVSDNALWVAVVGYALLAAGNTLKGF